MQEAVEIGILDEGMEKVIDLISDNLTIGQCGTGTSTVTAGDTGLDEAVGATQKTLSNTASENLLTTIFTLTTADGNGLSLTEFENQFSSGESLTRIRHTPISKDNTKELTYLLTFEIVGA